MKHVKGNPMAQHKIVSVKPRGVSKALTGRLSHGMHTLDSIMYTHTYRTSQPSLLTAHPMIVCSLFQQYRLTDSKYTSNGCCLPARYTAETYGYNPMEGQWYVLNLSRDTRFHGKNAKWEHTWRPVSVHRVPKQHQAAALLL